MEQEGDSLRQREARKRPEASEESEERLGAVAARKAATADAASVLIDRPRAFKTDLVLFPVTRDGNSQKSCTCKYLASCLHLSTSGVDKDFDT